MCIKYVNILIFMGIFQLLVEIIIIAK